MPSPRPVLVLLASVCAVAAAPRAAVAAPPASPEDARGELALYCAQECGDIALVDFSLRARLPRAAVRPVVVVADVTETWQRPTSEDLAQWGEGEVTGMEQAGQVVLLQWAAPPEEGLLRLQQVLQAAVGTASWVQDVDTGRLLGPDALAALAEAASAPAPDLSRLAMLELHELEDGTLIRTRGLTRLGLPELVQTRIPAREVDAAGARLNAVAQAVFESGLSERVAVDAQAFASESARLAACQLRGVATLEYGHAHARLLGSTIRAELAGFEGAFGQCADQPQAAAPPPPAAPPPEDGLQAALGRAKARLSGPVKQAFQTGLPAGDRLMVKAPFQGPGGKVSWLWLGVEQWGADDRLQGPLLSAPPADLGIAQGQVVQADLALVFDYLWRKADGSTEGNESQAFLEH